MESHNPTRRGLTTPSAGEEKESVTPFAAWYLPGKAVLDFVLGSILLILTLPLILTAALMIKLTSRGPAFFVQTRLGKHGRLYSLHKLRTMVDDAEAGTGPVWAHPDDPRVTPIGRFLRATHIDELPQLLNVVRGEMSLVGPRPERPELVARIDWNIPLYHERLNVRPGLTGMAQLRLPPDTTMESVREKLAYDLYYVQHLGPWFDVRIITFTILHLLRDFVRSLYSLVDLPSRGTIHRHTPSLEEVDKEIPAPKIVPLEPDWEPSDVEVS